MYVAINYYSLATDILPFNTSLINNALVLQEFFSPLVNTILKRANLEHFDTVQFALGIPISVL